MPFSVVLPARYDSQRLPGKPLADIAGKPLILHACDSARKSGATRVIVAADDARIREACEKAGIEVQMTAASHASGTDRIAEVAERLGWDDDELVVNLQGDEPMMPPECIEQTAKLLESGADMSTLCTPIHDLHEFMNPNVVKVVADGQGRALYFSRAPIPWNRDSAVSGLASQQHYQGALRHIGIYGYRVGALKRLSATSPCELEQLEKLEQLRALWLGMHIALDVAREVPGPSVDTPEDLKRVATLLKR
ncbi:MAG TPA: 3-deoxy-manno-octulosonate cytidylyltransferase [Gammaproteobacteria bacterium]|jgi:3-deoxy-manno-octulosonate cytidylyltransferase (CMP-KDO synthetase)